MTIEEQDAFLAKIEVKYDRKYNKMQGFLVTLLGIVLSASALIIVPQISSASVVKTKVEMHEELLKDTVSQKAIDNLIMTFENQTRVMEEYLPDDVQGAITEFNRVSSSQRAWIIMYNSQPRGGREK